MSEWQPPQVLKNLQLLLCFQSMTARPVGPAHPDDSFRTFGGNEDSTKKNAEDKCVSYNFTLKSDSGDVGRHRATIRVHPKRQDLSFVAAV